MLTNDGYFRQTDGLAMGSSLAPLIANCWMSKFDPQIKDDAMLYELICSTFLKRFLAGYLFLFSYPKKIRHFWSHDQK